MFTKTQFDKDRLRRFSALIVILTIAVIGVYVLAGGHAATPYASLSASQGSLANGTSLQSDTTASGNQRVVFGRPVPMDGNVALALSSPGTPFAASSFWNTPIPANAPLNPNSAFYASSIIDHSTLASATYSAPLYVVPANQPLVPVTRICGGIANPNAVFDNSVAGGVPVPADARAAVGTDGEIQIYQPSTNKYWDFWRFVKDSSGNLGACWGGGMTDVSGSDGIFPNNLGATAVSLPLLGGVVRIEELQAGQIDHAIGLILPNILGQKVIPADNCPLSPTNLAVNTPGAKNGISWPATRSDGANTDQCAIPEGLRFRLPASFNLAQYNSTLVANKQPALTPVAETIAVAAQKYGFVVYDGGAVGDSPDIRVGDPTTYTAAGLPNPYTSGPGVGGVGNKGLYNGVSGPTQNSVLMANFPWSQLQALPFNYGEPGL